MFTESKVIIEAAAPTNLLSALFYPFTWLKLAGSPFFLRGKSVGKDHLQSFALLPTIEVLQQQSLQNAEAELR